MQDTRFDAVLDEVPTMMILNYLLRKRPQIISVNIASWSSMHGTVPDVDGVPITLVPEVAPVSQEHYPGPVLAPDSDAPEAAAEAMASVTTTKLPTTEVPDKVDIDQIVNDIDKSTELKANATGQVPAEKLVLKTMQMPSPFPETEDKPVVMNETNPAPTQENAKKLIQDNFPVIQDFDEGVLISIIKQDGRFDSNPTVRKSQTYTLLGLNLGNNNKSHEIYLKSAAAYVMATRPDIRAQFEEEAETAVTQ